MTSGRATRWWCAPARGPAWWSTPGPTRRPWTRCLDRLDIEAVPLLVLTHFHADHVDGLAGVLDGRSVGELDVSPLADPPEGDAQVASLAARTGWSR